MKLSIILTVYNKESFLRRAFDALLAQKDTREYEYEILVVNDGSTDGSATIINEYVNNNSHIRSLTQENQGLSMARNNGVTEARGEYVWFVDADDAFSNNAVSYICDAMKTKPDIITFYAKTEGENRVRNRISPNVKNGKEILIQGQWESCGVFTVVRRDFLRKNNILFMPGIYHEDDEYTPRMLYAAQSAIVIPKVLYTVIHEPNSITGIPRAKRAFDYLAVGESLGQFVKEKEENETEIGKTILNHAALCINNALSVIILNNREDQKKFEKIFTERKQQLIKILLSSTKKKYYIEGMLFNFFSGKYIFIYKFLQRGKIIISLIKS